MWQVPRPRLAQSALALVPTIVGSALRQRALRWREIRYMIRLGALEHALGPAKRRSRVILMDEGPVFAIGWLDVAFAERGIEAPPGWRRRVVQRWAQLLDSVVFLDAQDRVLATRIRTRAKRHRMETSGDVALRRFARVFRHAFEKVIAELSETGHLTVQAMRTDGPLHRGTARLSAALERHRHGH
jgi:hypothetical protein